MSVASRLVRAMADVFERYGRGPVVGERAREFVPDPGSGRVSVRLLRSFELTSYRQLWSRIRAVASVWHHDQRRPLAAGDRVAFLGFTSPDYVTLDLACAYLGAVSVPLQTSASVEELRSIVAETGPVLVATSIERLDVAVELVLRAPSVHRMVVFDYHPRATDQAERFTAGREALTRAGRWVEFVALAEVLQVGSALPEAPANVAGEGEDSPAVLLYTSGSTGTPKGAIYTERMVTAMWERREDRNPDEGVVTVNYMPLNHLAGRLTLTSALVRGGTNYFTAAGDLSTLLEDIAMVRPTELALVPRVCELIHQRYVSELDRLAGDGADPAHDAAAVRARLREQILGGRVTWATCGSAPLSATLATSVESLLGVPLHNLYGSTEVGAIAIDGVLSFPPLIDYKLADVAELGYRRTDVPHPRGELRVKTDGIPGYFGQPELTAELFDEEGFYRTGDIVAELGPGRIAVVDRIKRVLKLSQGEFVALARLESLFAAAPSVRQIFLHGDSRRSFLLAVVVPTEDALQRWAADPQRLERPLLESFRRIAKENGLKPFETPRGLLIETEPFSQANGLLSDIRKLQWPKLVERYGQRLAQRYAEISDQETRELLDLRRLGGEQPVLEVVLRAVRALSAGSTATVSPAACFRDLGGDSLSAVSLSNLLHDALGVRVPVDVIISPAYDLRRLATYAEAGRTVAASRITFEAVHGDDVVEVHAGDLTLDQFVDPRTIEDARHLPLPHGAEPRCVLLTGASGFLGRFLMLEWLHRLARVGGRLIVLVRGEDPSSAWQSLVDVFGRDEPEPARTFEDGSAFLTVLTGDLAEPGLGLDEETWDRLATHVDLIVHAGALVNHLLHYRHLFGTNVAATAELIRLAMTRRIKPVTYLSTVAVSGSAGCRPLDEDADVRTELPVQPVDGGYARGYATSKWAGEVLLREAHDLCGLPVTVFRSSMMLAHSRYPGQMNVGDMFSRLLFSVLATGLAPTSFYRNSGTGSVRAHYDGLPVEFTAASVVAFGRGAFGYRTFSLVNPHDDGVCLDTFVEWLIGDGHGIERIADYDDWLARIEAGLRRLPEDQRQYSILPLLPAFRKPEPAVPGSRAPSARFQAAVQASGVGSVWGIPHLSPALIRKCVLDLQKVTGVRWPSVTTRRDWPSDRSSSRHLPPPVVRVGVPTWLLNG